MKIKATSLTPKLEAFGEYSKSSIRPPRDLIYFQALRRETLLFGEGVALNIGGGGGGLQMSSSFEQKFTLF